MIIILKNFNNVYRIENKIINNIYKNNMDKKIYQKNYLKKYNI